MANKYGKGTSTADAVKELQRQIKSANSGADLKKQKAAIDKKHPGLYKKSKNPLPSITEGWKK
jgi:hypothetical protein